jgi:hypothetical protein
MASTTKIDKGFWTLWYFGKVHNTGPLISVLDVRKTWVRTPGFRSLKATGSKLPDNPYTYMVKVRASSQGTVKDYYGDTSIVTGPISAGFADAPDTSLDHRFYLNQKLIERAKGQQWNAPIFFAEAGKTADMVVNRATHLAHMALKLRNGDFVNFVRMFHKSAIPPKRGGRQHQRFDRDYGRNAHDAVHNAWLEYSYGWAPFMNDVKDSMHTLMDLSDRPAAMETRVKARTFDHSKASLLNQPIFATDLPYGVRVDADIIYEFERDYRAIWRFRPNPADIPGRFGLINPLEVAWELVPFSFVADWFLPIGAYLSALDVPMRFQHVGGSYGSRRLGISEHKNVKGGTGFAGRSTSLIVSREAMGSAPTLDLKGFHVNGITSSLRRMFTSISLLNQQVSRLGR